MADEKQSCSHVLLYLTYEPIINVTFLIFINIFIFIYWFSGSVCVREFGLHLGIVGSCNLYFELSSISLFTVSSVCTRSLVDVRFTETVQLTVDLSVRSPFLTVRQSDCKLRFTHKTAVVIIMVPHRSVFFVWSSFHEYVVFARLLPFNINIFAATFLLLFS